MSKEKAIIILMSLAIIAVVYFLLLPSYDSFVGLRAIKGEEETKLANTKTLVDEAKKREQEYQDNLQEINKTLSMIPSEQQLAGLLIQLETLAGGNGLVMEAVDFSEAKKKMSVAQPPTMENEDNLIGKTASQASPAAAVTPAPDPYKILSINLKLSGGYDAFKKYLEALEKNVRLMDVTILSLSGRASQNEGGATSFSAGLGLNVYYQ